MRRTGKLIELVADMDNLRLSFYKAATGKEGNPEVEAFRNSMDMNLFRMREDLMTGNVQVGNYHYFTIFDPKERIICAASFSERVLHHALMTICHPIFERYQIYDSYACRKDKGTYAALERALFFQKNFGWYLKLDVKKYFDTIDHSYLAKQLARIIKDKSLLSLLDNIISSYQTYPGKGIPIGNLSSQYFANHLLAIADHYVKETLKIKGYVRYMDDMVLWHNDKNLLFEAGIMLKRFIADNFQQELKPFCFNHSEKGLPFLGYLVFQDKIRLAKRSRNRFAKKIKIYTKKLQTGKWNQEVFGKHCQPLIAFTEHASATGFRKKVLSNINGQWPKALTA